MWDVQVTASVRDMHIKRSCCTALDCDDLRALTGARVARTILLECRVRRVSKPVRSQSSRLPRAKNF